MIKKLITKFYIGVTLMSNSIIIDNYTIIDYIYRYDITSIATAKLTTESGKEFIYNLNNFTEQERIKSIEIFSRIIKRNNPMFIKHNNFKTEYIKPILCDNVIIGRDEPSRIFISLGIAPGALFINKNTDSYNKFLDLKYLFSQKKDPVFSGDAQMSNVKLSVVVNEPDSLVLYIGYHPEICS